MLNAHSCIINGLVFSCSQASTSWGNRNVKIMPLFSEGHVWVHGFTAVEVQGGDMLIFMTYITTKSMLVSVGHVAARGHVHVNGLGRLLRPY